MPNSNGGSNRPQRRNAKRHGVACGRDKPIAMPEIMNSNGIRQRLSTIIGHCNHSAVCTLLRWKSQSAT